MGRLKDKTRATQYTTPEPEPEPEIQQESEYQPTEEELQEYYYQQQAQQAWQAQQEEQERTRQEDASRAPLEILDEIRKNPSPKGTLPVLIGGRPIDLHILEDYIVKISPHALKTILRYHNARTIEEIKNYSTGPQFKKGNWGFWLLVIGLIGICVVGLVVLMFAPQLTAMFKNFSP